MKTTEIKIAKIIDQHERYCSQFTRLTGGSFKHPRIKEIISYSTMSAKMSAHALLSARKIMTLIEKTYNDNKLNS